MVGHGLQTSPGGQEGFCHDFVRILVRHTPARIRKDMPGVSPVQVLQSAAISIRVVICDHRDSRYLISRYTSHHVRTWPDNHGSAWHFPGLLGFRWVK